MFPDDHPEVQRDIQKRQQRVARAENKNDWDMMKRLLG
jgi:hypothetical protein